jgi:hypothetical protein
MSDSRVATIRKSAEATLEALNHPLLFVQAQFGYSAASILRPIHSMTQVNLGTYPDTFPNTITEVYWTQEGFAGRTPWIALGQLSNGLYFLYSAVCSETPKTFVDGGKMNLWVSLQFSDLIHFAMDSDTYIKYFNETKE